MVFSQHGDKKYYTQLLVSVEKLARRYLSSRLKISSDIDDLTQEILITVHNAKHTFDSTKPVLPWLYAIFRYRFQDYLRTHYRLKKHLSSELTPSVEATYTADPELDWEYRNLIQKLLSYLLPKQRTIVEMLYINGNSAQEVSKALEISVSNVRTTAHRSIKLIKARANKTND
jgi:RNA polymerase sigma-70 factor (ECF subfamily)